MLAPMVESASPHPSTLEDANAGLWAIAALGRLAESGTLARMTARAELLEDPVELADARLLATFGVLEPTGDGYRVPAGGAFTADAAAGVARTQLLQAIAHTRGQPAGWQSGDGAILLAQGRASTHIANIIERDLLPVMPEARAALTGGRGAFLDVGVGVAALSIAIAQRFPGTRIVGLDVLQAALEIASTQIDVAELRGTIELRLQSVTELPDEQAFDLAWVPQMFIERDQLAAGLQRVRVALRPGAWIVLALAGDGQASQIDAYHALIATTMGGGPMGTPEGAALLERHGYASVIVAETPSPQPLLLAQRAP
jgi:SAM-dependent methyltransferase